MSSWPGRTTEESVAIKLDKYLLNPEHINPWGRLTGKAAWFKDNLGFTRDNANDLARQIVFNQSQAMLTNIMNNGLIYRQLIEIRGANGRTKKIFFNWIKNPDGIVRLIGTGRFPKRKG